MSKYTIWVDGMDGDVYFSLEGAIEAIRHAVRHGAVRIDMMVNRPPEGDPQED